MTFKEYYKLHESPYSVQLHGRKIPRPIIVKPGVSPEVDLGKDENHFDFYHEHAREISANEYHNLFRNWTLITDPPKSFFPFWDKEQNIIFMYNYYTGESKPLETPEDKLLAKQMKQVIIAGSIRKRDKETENLIKQVRI